MKQVKQFDVYGAFNWKTKDAYVGCGVFEDRVRHHNWRADNELERANLLYVHMRQHPDELEFMKIKSFKTLKAARAYEKELIIKLQPSLNYQHNPKYKKGK